VKDDLFDCYSDRNFLNKKFETRFIDFAPSEVACIPAILNGLVQARSGYPPRFSQTELGLLERIAGAAGNLTVRRFDEIHLVSDLISGKPPTPSNAPSREA
jgi:hypothetical protein